MLQEMPAQLPFVISVYKMCELAPMSSMFSTCPQVSVFSTLLTKASKVSWIECSLYNVYILNKALELGCSEVHDKLLLYEITVGSYDQFS